jgi:hypothetical protein
MGPNNRYPTETSITDERVVPTLTQLLPTALKWEIKKATNNSRQNTVIGPTVKPLKDTMENSSCGIEKLVAALTANTYYPS